MHVGSGRQRNAQNGQLVTSSAGAMGLMQVMPETYDELRDRSPWVAICIRSA